MARRRIGPDGERHTVTDDTDTTDDPVSDTDPGVDLAPQVPRAARPRQERSVLQESQRQDHRLGQGRPLHGRRAQDQGPVARDRDAVGRAPVQVAGRLQAPGAGLHRTGRGGARQDEKYGEQEHQGTITHF